MKYISLNKMLDNAKNKEWMDVVRLAYLTYRVINKKWKRFEYDKKRKALIFENTGFRMFFDKLYGFLNRNFEEQLKNNKYISSLPTVYNDCEVTIELITHSGWSESKNKSIDILVGYRIVIPVKNIN